jgi:hypothetical protein
MNKFILSIVAVMALTVSSFANGPVYGPFISSADKTGFTTQSFGVQVDGNKLYVNYANDGKNLFAVSFCVDLYGKLIDSYINPVNLLFVFSLFFIVLNNCIILLVKVSF